MKGPGGRTQVQEPGGEGRQNDEVLRQEMCSEVDDEKKGRLGEGDNPTWIRSHSGDGSPDGKQGRLCDGTSPSNGKTYWEISTSYKRNNSSQG